MKPSARLRLNPSDSDKTTVTLLETLGCALTIEVKDDRPRDAAIDPAHDVKQALRGKEYLINLATPASGLLIISCLMYLTPGHDARTELRRPDRIDVLARASTYERSLLQAAFSYLESHGLSNSPLTKLIDLDHTRVQKLGSNSWVSLESSLDIYQEGYTGGRKNGSSFPGMGQFFPGKKGSEIIAEMKRAVEIINKGYIAATMERVFKTEHAPCEVTIGSEEKRSHPSIDVLVVTTPVQVARNIAKLETVLGPIQICRDVRERLASY